MDTLLIVAVVVVAVVIIVALALNPVIAKKNDAAINACKDALGRDSITLIEPRAVGFGTEPEDAGGLRGQGCLALNDSTIMFVTTAGQKEWQIDRTAVTGVDTAGDPRGEGKAMVMLNYNDPTAGEVTASFRLTEITEWLDQLGYDWGAEGPPPPKADDDDTDADQET